jgi:hypothetical protein
MNPTEVTEDREGHVVVTVGDHDTFDQLGDYFVEIHDLDPLWVKFGDESGPYVFTFEGHLLDRVRAAVASFKVND